jgi:hypothetical protein
MKYETAYDRHKNILNAIMATAPDGSGIYIDLLTITDSTEENHSKYQIKHGNYLPETENSKATWDQFYIDGKEDGFQNGFQSLSDVEIFLSQEIERIAEKKTESIISNENKSMGADGARWDMVLQAWKSFQIKFLEAKKSGRLIDVDKASEMKKSMIN